MMSTDELISVLNKCKSIDELMPEKKSVFTNTPVLKAYRDHIEVGTSLEYLWGKFCPGRGICQPLSVHGGGDIHQTHHFSEVSAFRRGHSPGFCLLVCPKYLNCGFLPECQAAWLHPSIFIRTSSKLHVS